jgi:hypothetical protein
MTGSGVPLSGVIAAPRSTCSSSAADASSTPQSSAQSSSSTLPVSTVQSSSTLNPTVSTAVPRVTPSQIQLLPAHIQEELATLRKKADSDGSILPTALKPVVGSVGIWLAKVKGVVYEQDHPGVLAKVG